MRTAARTLVIASVLLGWWTPAAAHTEVLRASPGPGEVVDGPVDTVALTFLDPVQPGVTIDVVDDLGNQVPGLEEAELSDDRRQAEVSFPALTVAGQYVVEYTFTAADGDTQRETYRFTIERGGDDDSDGTDIASVVAAVAALAVVVLGTVVSLRRRRRDTESSPRRGGTRGPDSEV